VHYSLTAARGIECKAEDTPNNSHSGSVWEGFSSYGICNFGIK